METTAKNIRFTLENTSSKQQFYCILKEAADYEEQFEKVFSIQKGYGFSIRCHSNSVDVYDYFAGEPRATFQILKTEPTAEAVFYYLQKTEG